MGKRKAVKKSDRELAINMQVTENHGWIARDGRAWAFMLIRMQFEGKPVLQPFPVLACEDDA